jgi:hypothetical protein
MKKIFIISVLFLCNCSDHTLHDPIIIAEEIVRPYIKEDIFNVAEFIKENENSEIIIIQNSKDSLEFFLFSEEEHYSVFYYKNGVQELYYNCAYFEYK